LAVQKYRLDTHRIIGPYSIEGKNMLGEKHDLAHELPEFKERIHELKVSNRHFAKLFDEYDELDHQVRRCEADIEVHADDYVEELKKKRLALKDELYRILKEGE